MVEPAAKRYAQAAFELAREHGDVAAWREALSRMAEFMLRPDVRAVLENSRVPQETKQELVTAGLNDLPPLAFNLARLLVRKGRTALVGDIAAAFGELVDAEQGVAHARARTAIELPPAEQAALAARLEQSTGKRVVLETEVDPSLLGGVVIQIGDRLIDASTRARLEALRQNLVRAV